MTGKQVIEQHKLDRLQRSLMRLRAAGHILETLENISLEFVLRRECVCDDFFTMNHSDEQHIRDAVGLIGHLVQQEAYKLADCFDFDEPA